MSNLITDSNRRTSLENNPLSTDKSASESDKKRISIDKQTYYLKNIYNNSQKKLHLIPAKEIANRVNYLSKKKNCAKGKDTIGLGYRPLPMSDKGYKLLFNIGSAIGVALLLIVTLSSILIGVALGTGIIYHMLFAAGAIVYGVLFVSMMLKRLDYYMQKNELIMRNNTKLFLASDIAIQYFTSQPIVNMHKSKTIEKNQETPILYEFKSKRMNAPIQIIMPYHMEDRKNNATDQACNGWYILLNEEGVQNNNYLILKDFDK